MPKEISIDKRRKKRRQKAQKRNTHSGIGNRFAIYEAFHNSLQEDWELEVCHLSACRK